MPCHCAQLEELTDIFQSSEPVKYSLRRSEVIFEGEKGVVEVLDDTKA